MSLQSPEQVTDLGFLPLRLDGGKIMLVDQRYLPDKLEFFDATALDDMCFAISDMVVRGAPSIGVAAAYAMATEAVRLAARGLDMETYFEQLAAAKARLQATRPTAVNLRWATEKIYGELLDFSRTHVKVEVVAQESMKIASQMFEDHIEINRTLSEFGADLVKPDWSILTHCNAGSLAACGWGTALGVIRSAALRGLNPSVYVDETRPRHQGSKLTIWELAQDKIPSTLICDSMSGHLMSEGKVQMVVTGADRIAANGDSANKIGTYNLAVVAKFHNVPFYIAAPTSTIDPTIATGKSIPIEERHASEITSFGDVQTSMKGVRVYNPAFDVTPANLIAGIITEFGVLRPPYETSIANALKKQKQFD